MSDPGPAVPIARRRRAGPAPSRFGWRWLAAAITAALMLAVLGASALEVVKVQRSAAASLKAQVALADLTDYVDGLRYWPQGYANGAPADAIGFSFDNSLRFLAGRYAAELAGESALGAPLVPLVRQLSDASHTEMDLVGANRLSAARAFATSTLVPIYTRLAATEARIDPVLAERADASGRHATEWIVGIVFGTGLGLVLILAIFESLRRQRARSVAEESALRASAERFRSLVQNSSDLIVVLDPDGAVVLEATSPRAVLGFPPGELEGDGLARIVHPDDQERLGPIGAAGGGPVTLRLHHADGTWRVCEVRAADLRDHPEIRGIVLNIRDITERRRLETELLHAQKLEAVGRLAAGVAHEINTPIQYVGDNIHFLHDAFGSLLGLVGSYREVLGGSEPLGWEERRAAQTRAEAVADVAYLQEEVPAAAGQALDGVRRVSAIVRAMKAFGHPDQGRPSVTDVPQALLNTIEIARNEFKFVADVVTDFAPVPPVRCVASDIGQVWLNLLVNAAHAIADRVGDSGGRGVITVSTAAEADDGTVIVTVSDTGTGIPVEVQERIFDPFFTTKEVGRGTGQGLAIARRIVDNHGGRIRVASTVGEGTTFTVRLPVAGPAGAIEADPTPGPVGTELAGAR